MEPYREDKPFISIDTETSLLDRLLQAGIPFTRALKYYRDNPEGSALETLKLAAEDVVPFYGTYRNDGDISDYAKEAAMLGVPMPYTKFPKGHPKAGEAIPNNLKEALGYNGWANAKSYWKHNHPFAKKLFADPSDMRYRAVSKEEGLSTTSRARRTYDEVTPVEVPAGPYQATNTGSNVQNRGGRASNTNAVRYTISGGSPLKGARAWQGDMYPPGRSLRKDDQYGPFQWEDKYSRKLNDVIDKNEHKWEYLINQTRPILQGKYAGKQLPKETAIEIALKQGRPDIAERIRLDDKPRVKSNTGEFQSITAEQTNSKLSNEEFKDIGNRQVEKELREEFASLPEDSDIRYRFADYYGVPDLYQSWMNDPLLWAKYKNDIQRLRNNREANNRFKDRKFGRTIER